MGTIAPAESLLGQLQRGRGGGCIQALREDVALVRPLLLECMLDDPRWDRQIETRSDYYAQLIIHTALPLDQLGTHLHAQAGLPPGDANDLALGTLYALADRGYGPATAMLRDYLSYGEFWEAAFEVLVENGGLGVEEMGRILDRRFPEDAVLDRELPTTGLGMHTLQEPWRSLRLVNPRVERILSAHEREAAQQQQQEEQLHAAFADRPTSELLVAGVDYRTARFAALAIREQVTAADIDLLLQGARHGDPWHRFVAFRGLERRAHPAAFPILRAFFEAPEDQPGFLYGAAVRAMVALPAGRTLDLARAWFDDPTGPHRHIALQILEAHATRADVPRVRAALLPSLRRDTADNAERYMQCGILEVLARFPDRGPYPEAETVFEEAGYAWTRWRAAEVLAASGRGHFSRGFAVECLWDCEERVRQVGCAHVDGRNPDASERLQALVRDPREDERVRRAAQERLYGGTSPRANA